MLQEKRIIVLHTIKHSDRGVVVQCYSRENGRESLYFRLASRNRTACPYLHRLNILDIVASNHGSSMPTINEISPCSDFSAIRTDIYKSTIAIFISELLLKSIKESEANPLLYNYLESSINMLENMPERGMNFHIHFIVHLTRFLGFMPVDNYSGQEPVFDFEKACFTPTGTGTAGRGETGKTLSEKESLLLHQLINTQAMELNSIECSGTVRHDFAKKMVEYISLHLDTRIELKSLDILHEVFN